VRARLPRLHKDWRRIAFALAPSNGELRSMVQRLQSKFGNRTTADLLGVSALTLRDWSNGRWRPCGASPKAIWLVHALIFHPETVDSLQAIACWGRFKRCGDSLTESSLTVGAEDWSV
jgi:hypothetical protein